MHFFFFLVIFRAQDNSGRTSHLILVANEDELLAAPDDGHKGGRLCGLRGLIDDHRGETNRTKPAVLLRNDGDMEERTNGRTDGNIRHERDGISTKKKRKRRATRHTMGDETAVQSTIKYARAYRPPQRTPSSPPISCFGIDHLYPFNSASGSPNHTQHRPAPTTISSQNTELINKNKKTLV